ncbi:MAG TPA: glycosyltransferase, partial [Polyangiaceae bacterium]|nr:glycosyltransferase [Polyangiaceae bacterium]
LRECQARSIRQADLLLSASQATRLDVIRQFGLESTVVKNGVCASRFARPIDLEKLTARLPALGPTLPRFVLSVGGVEPRKNSIQALAAFAEVALVNAELHWLIAGGASIWEHTAYRARFATELSKLPTSIAARVHVLGAVSETELEALYSSSSLLLHPAEQEGFGLCVLEALASGCPVIVPRGAPFDEYLDDRTAAVVDPHSTASIASALQAVLNWSASERASRRAAGLITARLHDWQSVARTHLAAYESAMRLTPSCTEVLHA